MDEIRAILDRVESCPHSVWVDRRGPADVDCCEGRIMSTTRIRRHINAPRARVPVAAIAARSLWLAMAVSAPLLGQQPAPDNLAPLAPLIGRWTGTAEGQPGKGSVERDYERALGSRFIRVRNRNTYPPQEKNPKGEIHEDEGFFSFDRARQRMLFRHFHIEGLVSTYVQDLDAKPGTLSFTTEAIENIPAGWRARETYILHDPDDLEEIFELAEQGKEFTVYSRSCLKRAR